MPAKKKPARALPKAPSKVKPPRLAKALPKVPPFMKPNPQNPDYLGGL